MNDLGSFPSTTVLRLHYHRCALRRNPGTKHFGGRIKNDSLFPVANQLSPLECRTIKAGGVQSVIFEDPH